MKKYLIMLAFAALAIDCQATVTGDNSCQGNCAATGAGSTATAASTNTNSNVNMAQGGAGGNSKSSAVGIGLAQQKQTQAQTQAITKSGNSSISGSGNATLTVSDSYRPVSSAVAPTILPTAVCMGSSSGGAQGPGFGVSMGTSWTDSNCMLLEQVRVTATVLGEREVAAEMLCAVDAYREARLRMGKPCLTPVKAPAAPAVAPGESTDKWVRIRQNLPPLPGDN